MPTEKELLDLYGSADELLHQAQREINAGEANRQGLEAILPVVNNQAPILDALNETEDQIASSIQDRNALHQRTSEIADAIIDKEKNR